MEKKYVPKHLVEKASEQDVFDILCRCGVPMKKQGNVYRQREHDSLVITPGKGFFWFSQDYGSKNPIDYFQKVENMDFVSAVKKVLAAMNYDMTKKNITLDKSKEGCDEKKRQHPLFSLPEKAENNRRCYAYLVKTRRLDPKLIAEYMAEGLIYQDKKYGNAVFLGKDYEGHIVSAFKRSTLTVTTSSYRGDQEGSQKDFRFRVENPGNMTVNVFESEIDLISYLSFLPEDERNENYVVLGGLSDKALMTFLSHRPDIEEINICTDNDEKGHLFFRAITEKLGKDYIITREVPILNDFNEDLVKDVPYERKRIDAQSFEEEERTMTEKEEISPLRQSKEEVISF